MLKITRFEGENLPYRKKQEIERNLKNETEYMDGVEIDKGSIRMDKRIWVRKAAVMVGDEVFIPAQWFRTNFKSDDYAEGTKTVMVVRF